MGSTCVCTWVLGEQLYIASVGDSRIYLLRDNQIHQLTTDHTWAQEAVEHGIISPEQVRGHPQSHIIRRYLGSKTIVDVDFRLRLHPDESDEQALANQGMGLQPGDKLLLCSDGLTDLVEENEIKEKLQWPDRDAALQELVDLANQRGGHDNITIVTLELPSQGEAPKKKAPSAVYWLVGIIVGLIVMAAFVTLAFFGWQYIQPESTATLPPPTATPTFLETEESQSEQNQATTTPAPLPTETPIQATVTIWPTSTGSP
jgi:protein phosphatase